MLLAASLLAGVLSLLQVIPGASLIPATLFGATLVLALLEIVAESDRSG